MPLLCRHSGGLLWPGTYTPIYLNTPNSNVLWMGSRWRLKKSFDIPISQLKRTLF
jgi:hypothetical protein